MLWFGGCVFFHNPLGSQGYYKVFCDYNGGASSYVPKNVNGRLVKKVNFNANIQQGVDYQFTIQNELTTNQQGLQGYRMILSAFGQDITLDDFSCNQIDVYQSKISTYK